MAPRLPADQLARLRRFNSCTISNAIETFAVRRPEEGLLTPAIHCIFPEMGAMVGYAVTTRIQTARPAAGNLDTSVDGYRDYLEHLPEPRSARVCVVQDLDPTPAGAIWGDVNASVHQALGFIGAVTNGGVRDLPGVRDLGFHFFAREVLVSHVYSHYVDYGTPVEVGGVGDVSDEEQMGIRVPRQRAGEGAHGEQLILLPVDACRGQYDLRRRRNPVAVAEGGAVALAEALLESAGLGAELAVREGDKLGFEAGDGAEDGFQALDIPILA